MQLTLKSKVTLAPIFPDLPLHSTGQLRWLAGLLVSTGGQGGLTG